MRLKPLILGVYKLTHLEHYPIAMGDKEIQNRIKA